jgi:hypothetical protein
MIMKAIERGVPEQCIAAALDIEIASLRVKVRLLTAFVPESSTCSRTKTST